MEGMHIEGAGAVECGDIEGRGKDGIGGFEEFYR